MSAVDWAWAQVADMTLEQGLVVGIALAITGILIQQYVTLEVDDRQDQRAQKLEAAQDEAIAIATPLVIVDVLPAGQRWPSIPVQRLTNGEDLIGGDPR